MAEIPEARIIAETPEIYGHPPGCVRRDECLNEEALFVAVCRCGRVEIRTCAREDHVAFALEFARESHRNVCITVRGPRFPRPYETQ